MEARNFISCIRGWKAGGIKSLQPRDFGVTSWDDFWADDRASRQFCAPDSAFAIQTELSGSNNSKVRFIYLGTEAIQTFSVLTQARIPPTAMVLQNHGLGSNWTSFGGESELYESACDLHALPKLLLVGKNTTAWPGFKQVSEYAIYGGQMHRHGRALFGLSNTTESGRPKKRSSRPVHHERADD